MQVILKENWNEDILKYLVQRKKELEDKCTTLQEMMDFSILETFNKYFIDNGYLFEVIVIKNNNYEYKLFPTEILIILEEM